MIALSNFHVHKKPISYRAYGSNMVFIVDNKLYLNDERGKRSRKPMQIYRLLFCYYFQEGAWLLIACTIWLVAVVICYTLDQRFSTWGTSTPGGYASCSRGYTKCQVLLTISNLGVCEYQKVENHCLRSLAYVQLKLLNVRGHSNNTWHFRGEGGVSKNVTGHILLVISLVKVDKTCHIGGGGGLKSAGKVSRIIWMARNYFKTERSWKLCWKLIYIYLLKESQSHNYKKCFIVSYLRLWQSL